MKVIDVIEDTLILLNKKTLLEKVQRYKLENQDDTSALLGNILSKSISPSIEDGSMSLNNVEDGGNIENSINTVNSEDGESVANNDSEVGGEEDGAGIVSIFDETDLNELDILVRCFNLVYSEICVYFLPLIKEEIVIFKNNRFYFNTLQKNILEALTLQDSYGNKLKFRQNFDYLLCLDCKDNKNFPAILSYSYYPDVLMLENDIQLPTNKLSSYLFAFGVAREFCVLEEDFENADIWSIRFESGLQNLIQSTSMQKSFNLKERRWE